MSHENDLEFILDVDEADYKQFTLNELKEEFERLQEETTSKSDSPA